MHHYNEVRKDEANNGMIMTADISFCVVPDPFLNTLFVLSCYPVILLLSYDIL